MFFKILGEYLMHQRFLDYRIKFLRRIAHTQGITVYISKVLNVFKLIYSSREHTSKYA